MPNIRHAKVAFVAANGLDLARVVCQVAPVSSPSCARWTPLTTRPPPAPRWRNGGRASWPWRATRAATTSTTSRDSRRRAFAALHGLLRQDSLFLPRLFIIYLFMYFFKSRLRSVWTPWSPPDAAFPLRLRLVLFFSCAAACDIKTEGCDC